MSISCKQEINALAQTSRHLQWVISGQHYTRATSDTGNRQAGASLLGSRASSSTALQRLRCSLRLLLTDFGIDRSVQHLHQHETKNEKNQEQALVLQNCSSKKKKQLNEDLDDRVQTAIIGDHEHASSLMQPLRTVMPCSVQDRSDSGLTLMHFGSSRTTPSFTAADVRQILIPGTRSSGFRAGTCLNSTAVQFSFPSVSFKRSSLQSHQPQPLWLL